MNKTKEDLDSFHAGMLAALAVVHLHGLETIYDEIVATTDEKGLIDFARRDDCLEWSGVGAYLKRKRGLR